MPEMVKHNKLIRKWGKALGKNKKLKYFEHINEELLWNKGRSLRPVKFGHKSKAVTIIKSHN